MPPFPSRLEIPAGIPPRSFHNVVKAGPKLAILQALPTVLGARVPGPPLCLAYLVSLFVAGRLDDVELDGVSPGHWSILGPVRWLPAGPHTQRVVGPCGQDRVGTLGPCSVDPICRDC